MKKFICFVLMMLMIIGLCGCQTQSDTVIIPSEPDPTPAMEAVTQSFEDIFTAGLQAALDGTDIDSLIEVFDFTPVTVIDNEYITMTIKGFKYDGSWPTMESYQFDIFVENKTDVNISTPWDRVVVNGYMIDPFFGCSVAAHSKINTTVSFYVSLLEENDIDTIQTVDFDVLILNEDTWDSLCDPIPCSITIS